MMSGVIRQETAVFLISVLHGVSLALLYDLLRALRKSFAHGILLISAEDFLYWLLAGFLTFCFLFSWTEGRIRGYTAVGIGLGALLYRMTLSAFVVKSTARVLWLLRRLLHLPKTVCAPLVDRILRHSAKIPRKNRRKNEKKN